MTGAGQAGLSVREVLAYLVGMFDGEGCLTINIEKDLRKRFISETGGWRIIPCVQFTNSDNGIVRHIAQLLATLRYHPSIQRYGNGSTHVRLFRMEEVKRFCTEARRYSCGEKAKQLAIFVDRLIPIFDARPYVGTDALRRSWTKELFLRAIDSVDEINQHKRTRRSARKYTREYFDELWGMLADDPTKARFNH